MRVETNLFLLSLLIIFSLSVYPVFGETQAYDFTLININGTSFSLSDYRGKVVLIDFFRLNPNCPPCIDAIPHLKGVYSKYSQSDVIMMSLSVSPLDTDNTLKNNFVEKYDIPWIVACGADQIAHDEYGVEFIPTLIIVDAEGDISYRHKGVTEKSTLISEIDSFFVTISSPKNQKYTAPFVPLNFTTNKAAFWIRYSLDGHENVTINGNTNLTDLADGTHDVVVYFKEESGNTVYSNKVYFSIDTATQQTGPPYTLIAILVGAVIVSLFVGIVIAGQLLGWSEPSKKRRKRSHSR